MLNGIVLSGYCFLIFYSEPILNWSVNHVLCQSYAFSSIEESHAQVCESKRNHR